MFRKTLSLVVAGLLTFGSATLTSAATNPQVPPSTTGTHAPAPKAVISGPWAYGPYGSEADATSAVSRLPNLNSYSVGYYNVDPAQQGRGPGYYALCYFGQ